MARTKSLIRQSEITRATRGLLTAIKAAGVTGDIEVSLRTGVISFRIKEEIPGNVNEDGDSNEWNSLL
jgi:hypothetical protein